MKSSLLNRLAIVTSCFFIGTFCVAHTAFGQLQSRTMAGNVTLVVDGLVVSVFESASSSKDFLVQILVQKSEAIRLNDSKLSTRYPAPGEYLYVHVEAPARNVRIGNRESSVLPRPNMAIRAMLQSGDHQAWVSASQEWYQEIGRDWGQRDRGPARALGVTTEIAFYGGKAALKVVKVTAGSPAQRAGIEPGMLILTADGRPVPKPDNLTKAERDAKGTLVLRVVEPKSRDERTVRVDLR